MDKKPNPLFEVAVRPFTQILDFKGRTARANFWLHLVCVYLASYAASMIVMTATMGDMLSDVEENAQSMSPEELSAMFDTTMSDMMGLMMPVMLMSILLYAAYPAILVRRMHDTGRSGWWAAPHLLLSIAGMLGGFWVIQAMIEQGMMSLESSPEDQIQAWLPYIGAIGLVGFAASVTWVQCWIMAVFKGQTEPNKYGDIPLSVIQ